MVAETRPSIRSISDIDRTHLDAMPEAELRQAVRVALAAHDQVEEGTAQLLWQLTAAEEHADLTDHMLDLLSEHWKERPGNWRDVEHWRRTRDVLLTEGRI